VWSTFAFLYVGVAFAAHPEHAITYFDIELAQLFLDEIPGNKYEGDSCMDDEPVSKDCSGGEPSGSDGVCVTHASLAAESAKGAIVHQIVRFCSRFSIQYRNLRYCTERVFQGLEGECPVHRTMSIPFF